MKKVTLISIFFFSFIFFYLFFFNTFCYLTKKIKPSGCLDQVAAVGGFLLVKGLEAALHRDITLNSFQYINLQIKSWDHFLTTQQLLQNSVTLRFILCPSRGFTRTVTFNYCCFFVTAKRKLIGHGIHNQLIFGAWQDLKAAVQD